MNVGGKISVIRDIHMIFFFLKQDFWRELLPLRFQLESVAKILNTGKQSKAVTLRTEAKCIIWRLGGKTTFLNRKPLSFLMT